MFYKLEDGSVVEFTIGNQDFEKNIVKLKVNGVETEAPMFWDDGDIGFSLNEEEVLFHWMNPKLAN